MKNSALALEFKDDDTDPVAAVTAALAGFKTELDGRLSAMETKAFDPAAFAKLVSRIDGVEAKANRPGVTGDNDNDDAKLETMAFESYMRRGDRADELTLKTLRVSNDPQGGYFAPPEMSTEFLKNLVLLSPVRGIASVRTTGSPSVIYPARTGGTNAKWKGELQESEASEPLFGQAEIVVREVNTFTDISNQLLADGGGAPERELREALSEDFGAKEGTAFVNGDGVIAPQGFMTHPDIAFTANGHATNLSADALITLMYAIPAVYRANAVWAMNGNTVAVIRKMKDGQGNYLWQPSYQAGQPETILGKPVVELPDMPDVGAGLMPIAFGDFNLGYRIIDRLDLSILVNPYTRATEGVTRFHATRRTGAGVIRPATLRKLKMVA
ncbi:phage major capsid protein [Tardiphaga sp. vice304]|uniref:phage major capsid protein n=1 Tax=Tardiphaga sp. vice304 TaxID=2592817 RepID=UPI001161E98F|nr:phage major capsid protein [Tardiphaga sp. vice304]QDM27575.1 phage major capsid protein [Tardiphaga sp. vice304]